MPAPSILFDQSAQHPDSAPANPIATTTSPSTRSWRRWPPGASSTSWNWLCPMWDRPKRHTFADKIMHTIVVPASETPQPP
jgi:hypothetical protein